MWADGVFGSPIDEALMGGAILLCLGVTWRCGRRLGRPRFPGALAVFWLTSALVLPLPLYLACGVGLWTGILLFDVVGLDGNLGAMAGWVLTPPLLCFVALRVFAFAFTGDEDQ